MKYIFILFCTVLLFLVSCTTNPPELVELSTSSWSQFENKEFGFKFKYPSNWNEVTKDLPNNWAITKNKDTILFTTNKISTDNLLKAGKIAAIRDLNPGISVVKLSQNELNQIDDMVAIIQFGNLSWYTYAIKYSEQDINSIVSGVNCGNKEVNLVLVSGFDLFENNKIIYNEVLNSFQC